jgi:hypothetical protein
MSMITHQEFLEVKYEALVPVQLTDEKVKLFTPWFKERRIKSYFAYGKYYFKNSEDALAFKLKFGHILHGA